VTFEATMFSAIIILNRFPDQRRYRQKQGDISYFLPQVCCLRIHVKSLVDRELSRKVAYLVVPTNSVSPILTLRLIAIAECTSTIVDEANESDVPPILVFEFGKIESIHMFLPNRFRSTFRSEQVSKSLVDPSEVKERDGVDFFGD